MALSDPSTTSWPTQDPGRRGNAAPPSAVVALLDALALWPVPAFCSLVAGAWLLSAKVAPGQVAFYVGEAAHFLFGLLAIPVFFATCAGALLYFVWGPTRERWLAGLPLTINLLTLALFLFVHDGRP